MLLRARKELAERTRVSLELRSLADKSVQNCRALQDAQAPLMAKAGAFDAVMKMLGFPAEAGPEQLPEAVHWLMLDQMRYAMHRDVLRMDRSAWEGIQDIPQHKVSATEYDHATDRRIARWRQAQQTEAQCRASSTDDQAAVQAQEERIEQLEAELLDARSLIKTLI
ncbi:hypothetical protein [Pseudomonas aeruginosa]|uniref:hypothetical protein n=1 Tax=Pseudomonas aeruginosa TaxID=287 RepID=UPI0028D92610|nr:hypothetical protein [Pseudomonas aeruginosa]MDT8545863.1 hypothetical protein [Pseudomonas aeruginosa]